MTCSPWKWRSRICLRDKIQATKEWHCVDQTDALWPIKRWVKEWISRSWSTVSNAAVRWSRHRAATSPLSAASSRSLYTFITAVSVLRYADCVSGIKLLLFRKACSLIWMTLSGNLERNDRLGKSMLGVTYPVNLCTIWISLKYAHMGLFFAIDIVGLSLLHSELWKKAI